MRAVQQALRLFEQLPPSVDKAKAWRHLGLLLVFGQGPGDARRAAFTHGLEVAEAVGDPGVAAIIQLYLAQEAACTAGSPKVSNWRNEPGHWPTCPGTSRRWWRSTAIESEILLKIGR
jgi:hypothetical protein